MPARWLVAPDSFKAVGGRSLAKSVATGAPIRF